MSLHIKIQEKADDLKKYLDSLKNFKEGFCSTCKKEKNNIAYYQNPPFDLNQDKAVCLDCGYQEVDNLCVLANNFGRNLKND